MVTLNPQALCFFEGGAFVAIEDIEADGRWFRLEYRSDPRGRNATARCLYNPVGADTNSIRGHLFADGRLCIGTGTFDLETVVRRARYWTLAYTHYRQQGSFPNP
jgi:hypothetical protein